MTTLPKVENSPVLFRKNVVVNEPGNLYLTRYYNGDLALALGNETEGWIYPISVNLEDYDLHPDEDCVFIPDYSEHVGVTDTLVKLGVGEKIRKATFGPYNTSAYELRLIA